jgi:hypothetical protein
MLADALSSSRSVLDLDLHAPKKKNKRDEEISDWVGVRKAKILTEMSDVFSIVFDFESRN